MKTIKPPASRPHDAAVVDMLKAEQSMNPEC